MKGGQKMKISSWGCSGENTQSLGLNFEDGKWNKIAIRHWGKTLSYKPVNLHFSHSLLEYFIILPRLQLHSRKIFKLCFFKLMENFSLFSECFVVSFSTTI